MERTRGQPSGNATRGRLVASYWFAPSIACLAAPLLFLLLRSVDTDALTPWLLERDLAPVGSAGAASEAASALTGIFAAFLTLYFSISLLVLTIATSNLGVRLIDRWLGNRLSRATIASLAFALIFAALTLAAIDADAPLAETPLGSLAVALGLLVANTVLLAIALHELGRTMFVDRAIDRVGTDAQQALQAITGRPQHGWEPRQTILSERAGYAEPIDIERLRAALGDQHGMVRLCAAPGQHLLAGEPLVMLEHPVKDPRKIVAALPISPYRSDTAGAVFRIRLLVEIAARALSPAINDFYSAIAAVDAITRAMAAHADRWVGEGQTPVLAEAETIECPGQDLRGLFDDPLAALRQAAADYPAVSIRLIEAYARVSRLCADADASGGLAAHLHHQAREVAEHAASRCEHEADRAAIARALADGFKTASIDLRGTRP